jgi:hypothetical protein
MRIWVIAGVCCALGILLGALFSAWAQRKLQRRAAQARSLRGKRGEEQARAVLEDQGYRVIDRQRRVAYAVAVGASARTVELVLDYVVAREGDEELVAEVKTGPNAPKLKHADTRRQLLEYQLATGCSRVLLVDPESARITEVSFPLAREAALAPDPTSSFAARVALLLLVIAAACWSLLRQP